MLSSLFASLFARIAGVAIAAAAATGGLAAAGALPAPAQQAVSHAAATVGIHVPSPEHASSTTESPVHSPSPAPTSTAAEGKPEPKSTEDTHHTAPSSADSDANHGACVSYAASVAESLGMTGSLKGQFISALARDDSALSAKVSDGGKPDAACQAAIDKAKAAASSPGQAQGEDGASHGKPEVTATATAGSDGHPGASDQPGSTDHPGATATATPGETDHPGATSNPGTGSNPAGVSPTNHPGKP